MAARSATNSGHEPRAAQSARADAERVLNHVKGVKSSTFGKHYDQHGYDDEKYAALLKWERELRRILAFAVEDNVVELKRA